MSLAPVAGQSRDIPRATVNPLTIKNAKQLEAIHFPSIAQASSACAITQSVGRMKASRALPGHGVHAVEAGGAQREDGVGA